MKEHPLHRALAVFLQNLPSHPQLISPSLVLGEAREPDHWDRLEMPEVIYKLGEELGIDRRALSSVVRQLGRGMSEVMSSPAYPSHELKIDKRRRGSLDFYVQPVKQ